MVSLFDLFVLVGSTALIVLGLWEIRVGRNIIRPGFKLPDNHQLANAPKRKLIWRGGVSILYGVVIFSIGLSGIFSLVG